MTRPGVARRWWHFHDNPLFGILWSTAILWRERMNLCMTVELYWRPSHSVRSTEMCLRVSRELLSAVSCSRRRRKKKRKEWSGVNVVVSNTLVRFTYCGQTFVLSTPRARLHPVCESAALTLSTHQGQSSYPIAVCISNRETKVGSLYLCFSSSTRLPQRQFWDLSALDFNSSFHISFNKPGLHQANH